MTRLMDPLSCVVCGRPAPRGAWNYRRLTCSEECRNEASKQTRLDQIVDGGGRTWTHESILVAIQRWVRDHRGRPPTATQWVRAGSYWPNMTTVVRHFGTWTEAIRLAGYKPWGMG